MYIASLGTRYLVKRMPGTGPDHHPDCPSYEPYAVEPTPPVRAPDGDRPAVRLALSTRQHASRSRPGLVPDEERITLADLLPYLWHEAGLTRWSPAMAGKRHWGVVSWHLREAAADTITSTRAPLGDRLLVPAPYRRAQPRPKFPDCPEAPLVIGELKSIGPARYGHRLQLKHLPETPVYLDDATEASFREVHQPLLDLRAGDPHGHLMAIAALRRTRRGSMVALDLAVLITNRVWLPYRTNRERMLIEHATDQGRRFIVTPRDTSALVLTDAHRPIAVHAELVAGERRAAVGQWEWSPDGVFPAASRRADGDRGGRVTSASYT